MSRTRIIAPLASLALAAVGCLGGYAPGTPGSPGTPGTPGTPATSGNGGSGGSGGGGGGGGGSTTPSLTARQMFDANVAPVFGASCATCHAGSGPTAGPTFLGTGGPDYYGKLLSDPRFVNNNPQASLLLTKGAHEGPALTVAQGNSVLAWLKQEVTERGSALPNPPTSGTGDNAAAEIQKFGNCMALTDFNSSGMTDLHNQRVDNNGSPCDSCHQTGDYVLLPNTPTTTFNALKTVPYILKFAVASINPDGSFKDIVPADRFLNRGQEPGHPRYTLTTARATALTNFFQLTYTKYKAGNCPTTTTAGTPDGGM